MVLLGMVPLTPCIQDTDQDCLQVRAVGGDQNPHIKLTMHWFSRNKQRVTSLLNTKSECTLIQGNPQEVPAPLSVIASYGGHQSGSSF